MGRHKMTDLLEFMEYLQDRGLTPQTIKNYCSHVRTLRANLGVPTAESLTAYIEFNVEALSRSTVRAAWNAYRDSVIAAGGTAPPEALRPSRAGAPLRSGIVPPKGFSPPDEVARAVRYLVQVRRIPAAVLRDAVWGDLTAAASKRGPLLLLRHRDIQNTSTQVEPEDLRPLMAWAAPDTGKPKKTQPLLPDSEGGVTLVRIGDLRRLLDTVLTAPGADVVDENVFDLEATLAPLRGQAQAEAASITAPGTEDSATGAASGAAPTASTPPKVSRFAQPIIDEKDLPPPRIGLPRNSPSDAALLDGLK